jgi:hypothetical protein
VVPYTITQKLKTDEILNYIICNDTHGLWWS